MARLGTWDREKEKERDGEGEGTVRATKKVKAKGKKEVKHAPKSSGSSFKVGALGIQRKRSILGLRLWKSSTMGKSSGIGIGMAPQRALRPSVGSVSSLRARTPRAVFLLPPPRS